MSGYEDLEMVNSVSVICFKIPHCLSVHVGRDDIPPPGRLLRPSHYLDLGFPKFDSA